MMRHPQKALMPVRKYQNRCGELVDRAVPDIARQRTTLPLPISDKGAEMILDDAVARRELWAPPLVHAWLLGAGHFHKTAKWHCAGVCGSDKTGVSEDVKEWALLTLRLRD